MLNVSFSKNQRTVELLARDMLGRQVGERIPTSMQYQELIQAGSGTVQKALRMLEGVGAIALRARGHQGTLLVEQRIGALWTLAGLSHVAGAAPLPDSDEGAGLAAGLRSEFDRIGIPLQMLYMHGSANRLRSVTEGRADLAILSKGAATDVRSASQPTPWVQLDFGPYSYYASGSIVVLLRSGLDQTDRPAVHMIAIDLNSDDHTRLTFAEFPESAGHRYERYDYPRIPAAVAEGRVDAAIWHRTSLAIPLELAGIKVRPLQRPEALEVCETVGQAVLVAPPGKREVAAVLRSLDLGGRIRETQEGVMRHEIAPVY